MRRGLKNRAGRFEAQIDRGFTDFFAKRHALRLACGLVCWDVLGGWSEDGWKWMEDGIRSLPVRHVARVLRTAAARSGLALAVAADLGHDVMLVEAGGQRPLMRLWLDLC